MNAVLAVFKREFRCYFATPIAFVFIIIFLFSVGSLTFEVGNFYANGTADLSVFFGFHPWLYLFLVPALAMRLWAEERRIGTMELLLTLPVPPWKAVVGKFLAAWAFTGIALALTFPIWLTVNYLGNPDNGVILASYVGSFFMAGGYLAIGACISATTSNQVIAFVVSVVVCFLFTISGAPLVIDFMHAWMPIALVEAVVSFSFITHFAAISRGVIDLRDVVFFASVIALFLTANVVTVNLKRTAEAMTRNSRRAYALAALALAVVAFFSVNIFADAYFDNARIDLTANGQFTLSQGTRNIIAKIPEQITLKFYYSRKIAGQYADMAAYAKQVRDLLTEYASLSNGKIVLKDIDPEPFTPEEDEATAAGLVGISTDSGDNVYFGLVGNNSIDGRQVIPYFSYQRQFNLEYDISALIHRLSTPQTPVVGIVSSLPFAGNAAVHEPPLTIFSELMQNYKTVQLDANFKSIPSNVDMLLVAHPTRLDDESLAAIDQFVLNGGRLLAFVDPLSELVARTTGGSYTIPPPSDLGPLLKSWGVDYDANQVLVDKALALSVSPAGSGTTLAYPLWLRFRGDDFDTTDPITASLQVLNLASVGVLTPIKGATTSFVPLVRSSDQASLVSRMQASLGRGDPSDLLTLIKPTHIRYTVAARITGPAMTAYPGRPGLRQSRGPIAVVLIADSDIFDDRFWMRNDTESGRSVPEPFADNAALVLNAVENLTGSEDLISLRTRTMAARPFVVVDRLRTAAQNKFQETGKTLRDRLTAAQQRLLQLQQGGGAQAGGNVALTPDQKTEIERIQRELIDTRAQLRQVQHNLRKNIDALGDFLAFINIALIPILIGAVTIVIGLIRWWRRRTPKSVTDMREKQPRYLRVRGLLWLGSATLVLVVLSIFALRQEAAKGALSYGPVSVLPGFAARVNDAASIHILSRNADFDIRLIPNKGWILPGHNNYPADFDLVRHTLIGLAGLEIIEPKTARTDWLPYLDLDAPPKGAGVLLTVSNNKGQILASLITGSSEDIGDRSGARGLFVRKPGDNQSYLGRAVFIPQTDPDQWLSKNVVSIPYARMREVDVDPAQGVSFTVWRDKATDPNFAFSPLPNGRLIRNPGLIDDVANSLSRFTFSDVEPTNQFDFSKAARIVAKTFDGLSVTIHAIRKDGAAWATVSANPLPGATETAAEASAINARANGWAFRLETGVGSVFLTNRDELLNAASGPAIMSPPN